MSQSIDSNTKKRIESAAHNLEEALRRIDPFVRRPKEEPKKRENWVSSGTNAQIHIINQKSPNQSTS